MRRTAENLPICSKEGWIGGMSRRQNTGDRRQETGDRRQNTGDRRQNTGDRRQNTGDRRQNTGDEFTRDGDASKCNPEGPGCKQMQKCGIPTLLGWVV
ncbi:MAG TPA: hypothetical protein VJ044_11690 [Candidatus Hodarchaeales archaeon]|nr:hypothetical protein [Candidatus Hodarchaeales archaeon]